MRLGLIRDGMNYFTLAGFYLPKPSPDTPDCFAFVWLTRLFIRICKMAGLSLHISIASGFKGVPISSRG